LYLNIGDPLLGLG